MKLPAPFLQQFHGSSELSSLFAAQTEQLTDEQKSILLKFAEEKKTRNGDWQASHGHTPS